MIFYAPNTKFIFQVMTSINVNLLTAIMSRVATLISASSKDHVTIEYHVMCLVFCMYSTFRGFSTLSAPPVNGGVPKANGPVPNEM